MSNISRWLDARFPRWLAYLRKQSPKKVHKETWNVPSTHLGYSVQADLYLPPAFYDSSQRESSFPVLFFNDGQDMEAVQLIPTLERLYAAGKIPPILVVAFHPRHRMQEYGTIDKPDYKGRGSKASAYAAFLTQEFIPKFQRQYPAEPLSKQWVIAGFSLGGLSALDLAWNYPDQFGKVGVFSGALWWRSEEFKPKDPDADRIMHERIKKEGKKEALEFWFQTGTMDETSDRNKNGVIDAIDDTLDLIKELQAVGYPEEVITYVEVEDGKHDPPTWAIVLPDFLEWAFPKN